MVSGVHVWKGPGFCTRGCPRPPLEGRKMCEPCTLRNRERNGLEGNKLAVRRYQLRKYGLTIESYADMLDEQGGVCAICGDGNPPDKNLHVDHCHDTGKVRGLLCAACNKGIGMLRDNAATVYAAARYLERATA